MIGVSPGLSQQELGGSLRMPVTHADQSGGRSFNGAVLGGPCDCRASLGRQFTGLARKESAPADAGLGRLGRNKLGAGEQSAIAVGREVAMAGFDRLKEMLSVNEPRQPLHENSKEGVESVINYVFVLSHNHLSKCRCAS